MRNLLTKKRIAFFILLFVLALVCALAFLDTSNDGKMTALYRQNFPSWLVYPRIPFQKGSFEVRDALHTYAFFFIGLASAFFFIDRSKIVRETIYSFIFCVSFSNIIQLSRLMVPGREYDPIDLIFDAAGYIIGILIVAIIEIIFYKAHKNESN